MKKTILAMLMLIAIGSLISGCKNETVTTESTNNTVASEEENTWKLSFEGYDESNGWFVFTPYGENDSEEMIKATGTDNSAILQNTEKRILLGGGYDVFPTDMYEGQDYIRIDMEITTLPPTDQLEEVQFGDKTYYSWNRCTYDSCDAPGVTEVVYYYEKNGEVFSFEIHAGLEVETATWQAVLATVQ